MLEVSYAIAKHSLCEAPIKLSGFNKLNPNL